MGVGSFLQRVNAYVTQTHTQDWSVSDPALAEHFGVVTVSTGLPTVTEAKALAIPAYSRGEQIIAGTIAGLPLKTYRSGDRNRAEVVSVLDNPQGPVPISPFAWVDRCVTHLVRYGELYLKPIYSGGDFLLGLEVVHPGAVRRVEAYGWGKSFTVQMAGGREETFTDVGPGPQMVQILGPGSNTGQLRGQPIYVTSAPTFQIAIAAMTAIGRVFTGALVRGFISADGEEEIEEAELVQAVAHINDRVGGAQNAGQYAAVNRHLKFTDVSQRNDEAQYAETLTQVTEAFARLLGLPPHLLAAIDKQTSWGTGIAEQNIGLARYCLMSYTSRLEESLVRFLPPGQFCEFDYKGLLQGSPAQEADVLVKYKDADIIDKNEARAVLNLPPQADAQVSEVVTDG